MSTNLSALDGHAVPVVAPGSFLTLHYRLSGPDGGTIVETFGTKPATLSVGEGALAPALEACLIGMAEGQRRTFDGAAGQVFGDRNPAMVQRVALTVLREWGDADTVYAVGDVVQFPAPAGQGQGTFTGMVRDVGDTWLLIDFNHPLAGQAVTFEAQIIGVL